MESKYKMYMKFVVSVAAALFSVQSPASELSDTTSNNHDIVQEERLLKTLLIRYMNRNKITQAQDLNDFRTLDLDSLKVESIIERSTPTTPVGK